ncbi:MAG: diaminopimelate epimerase [Actinobacteria bacterium]|nr:diaminopimelate epimerase [Actinomycetota bacterium]
MRFAKWQGLGNDYIILEEDVLPGMPSPSQTALLCDRHFGVGADGLLIHCRPTGIVEGAVARMRIFNPDGSEPEMCGNGIRMFARYLQERGVIGAGEAVIETLAGPIRPQVLTDGRVRVHMGVARLKSAAIDATAWEPIDEVVARDLEVDGASYRFTFVDVGNPHCVIPVDDVGSVSIEEIGPRIETHPIFPRRTNVEFIRPEADGLVTMRVWERGVGETQACGTGATAVGVAAVRLGLATSPVTVHLPGGTLEIEVADDLQVVKTGSAEAVFTGELSRRMLDRLGWAAQEQETVRGNGAGDLSPRRPAGLGCRSSMDQLKEV